MSVFERPLRSSVRPALAWVIACFVAAQGSAASAAAPVRRVLVVYSNSRLLPANVDFDRGLRSAGAGSPGQPIELFEEFLDEPRFSDRTHVEIVAAYLRGKYAAVPPDVIVAGGPEALSFLLRSRSGLFPGTPVVHAALTLEELEVFAPLPADVVGTLMGVDFAGTVEQALRWRPGARRLVVVTGASERDRQWETRLRAEAARFTDRLAPEFLAGLPTGELLARLAALGEDGLVFTPGYFVDGDGRQSFPRDSVAAIAAASRAPVYAYASTFLGTGIVGGYMVSFEAQGREAGRFVNRLLEGTPPASLRPPTIAPSVLEVDWRQARRWGIDERAIPADSVVHFRTPTFLELHRNRALAAAGVFMLQAGLIGLLLVERRRRHSAELNVQLVQGELAHASRLAVAGELTAALAHEINQPLGAILSNADTADMVLESGANNRDLLRKIIADIRRDDVRASEVVRRLRALLQKQETHRQRFDLNEAAAEAELVLRAEAQRRRVALHVRPPAAPAPLLADRVQVQQVLINLVINAMDAVGDLPADRRVVSVVIERAANRILMTVRDRGPGIPAEHLERIFESFFSTKRTGMGLGLSITRTLVEAHDGRIWAENDPSGGAVFRVDLPAAPERGSLRGG